MSGCDYPHDEGTWAFTREHLRLLLHDTDPDEPNEALLKAVGGAPL